MDSPFTKKVMAVLMIVGLAFSILYGLSSSRTHEPKGASATSTTQ